MISITTWNVNGMRDHLKRVSVLDWARNQGQDITLIQETHKTPTDAWEREWEGQSFWAHGSNFSAGCGLLIKPGVDIQLHDKWADTDGRYIISNLKVLGSWLTIVCVYVPDKPALRSDFLDSLKLKLTQFQPKGPLVLGGDFNLVFDAHRDRVGKVLPQFLRGGEELEALLKLFGLFDPFEGVGDTPEDFTWSNKTGTTRSRLDRFYVQPPLDQVVVSHLPFRNSDHRPVLLQVHLEKQERGPGYWKLNTSVLGELGYRLRVEGSLAVSDTRKNLSPLDEWWDETKARIAEISRTYCKQRAKRFRSQLNVLSAEREELAAKRDLAPEDRERMSCLDGELSKLRSEKSKGSQVRSGIELAEVHERPNAYFYAVEKQRAKARQMDVLDTDEGTLNQPQAIREYVVDFYRKVYSEEEIVQEEMDWFLSHVEDRFPKEQEGRLIAPISGEEIAIALRSAKKGKSPGLDGLPYDFYIEFEDIVRDQLAEVFNFCLQDKGALTDSQRKAVITLIPKNDEVRSLHNWRPISLQNCDAKILAMVLANRLKPCLPDLVRPSQVCSVPGRQIQNHILLVREAIAYAKHKGSPLYVLSLDQEKAFDRVNWRYMFGVLRRLGVPEAFINYVKVLYYDPESAININGHITAFFRVLRGVRQGCPLSILLYVILAEPLGEAIKRLEEIDGVCVPGDPQPLKVVQFADDTNTFLSSIDSVYPLFELFERYRQASGARLKVSKTRGIAVNHPPNRPRCPEIPIKWDAFDTKILGVNFTPDLMQSARLSWSRVLNSIERRLATLKARDLSLRGRAQILNAIVLSKAWHVGRIFLPDPATLRRLLKLCFQYVWQSGHETVKRETISLPLERGGLNLLPALKHCAALQISDLLRINTTDEPPWCAFAKYWIGDKVKNFKPEWHDLASNNRPKHVIGKKPHHFELIVPQLREGIKALDGKTPTIKTIRRGLAGDVFAPIPEAQKHFQSVLGPNSKWETRVKHTFDACVPAKHLDTKFLFLHNALPVMANIAKWNRWHDGQNPKCPFCRVTETPFHLVSCRVTSEISKFSMDLVEDVLPGGMSPVAFLTGHHRHVTARSLAAETLHQIWRVRCGYVYERQVVTLECVSRDIITSFLKAVNASKKPASFVTRKFQIGGGGLVFVP